MPEWIPLNASPQLNEIEAQSSVQPQIIFKHSTRCGISSRVLSGLNGYTGTAEASFYFLDLISFRSISHEIAERFAVPHESPQALVIWQAQCIYHESHYSVTMENILQAIGRCQPAAE